MTNTDTNTARLRREQGRLIRLHAQLMSGATSALEIGDHAAQADYLRRCAVIGAELVKIQDELDAGAELTALEADTLGALDPVLCSRTDQLAEEVGAEEREVYHALCRLRDLGLAARRGINWTSCAL